MNGSSILCILNHFDMVHHGFITKDKTIAVTKLFQQFPWILSMRYFRIIVSK